jgi:hypothetical protein
MSPADAEAWALVWQPSVMSWDLYSYTFAAGVRALLFRMPQPVRKVVHNFKLRSAGEATAGQKNVAQAAAGTVSAKSLILAAGPTPVVTSDDNSVLQRIGAKLRQLSLGDRGSEDAELRLPAGGPVHAS